MKRNKGKNWHSDRITTAQIITLAAEKRQP